MRALPFLVALPLSTLAFAQADFQPPFRWASFVGQFEDVPGRDGPAGHEVHAGGSTTALGLEVAPESETYVLRFEGTLHVDSHGSYRAWTTSDDGTRLWINGDLVVDNAGQHGARRRNGDVVLPAGEHPFVLQYH